MKINQMGRSMIEMLGVLAIIGVLSIGAINGYSRAIFKYRLNKQAEQLNTLYSVAQQYAGKFHFNNASNNGITSTLYKLKLIPDEMVTLNKNGTVSKIEDIWGNRFSFYVTGDQTASQAGIYHYAGNITIEYTLYGNNDDQIIDEICRNVFLVAKEYSDSFYILQIQGGNSQIVYFGLNYCHYANSWAKCVKDLTFEKINEMCNIKLTRFPYKIMYISWRP